MPHDPFSVLQVVLGFVFAILISFLSFYFRFLTTGGAFAAASLGIIIFGLGGLPWAVPLLIFFFSSNLLFKRNKTIETESVFEKTVPRDAWQVLANGGVGGVLAILQFFVSFDKFYLAYLGSVAAVTADTWGTEGGMLTSGRTFSIITFQPVPRGTSGGVSLLGTSLGIAGALLIASSGWWWEKFPTGLLAQVVFAGVAGSFLDSILGATLQAHYKCPQCGKNTERTMHCNSKTELVRGFRWFTNDWVNVVCAGAGATVAILL